MNTEKDLIQLASHKTITLSEFLGMFVGLMAGVISESTLRSYRLSTTTAIRIIGDKPLCEIKPFDWENFKSQYLKEVRPTSVNVALRSIKAMLNRAEQWGLAGVNSLQGVRLVKVPQQAPSYLSRDVQVRFLDSIEDLYFRSLFSFLFNTGLRIGEALALRWSDVDLERRQARIISTSSHVTKTRTNRVVPLNGQALAALATRTNDEFVFSRDGRAPSATWISHCFKSYARQAGLPEEVHLHSTRHSFASNLAEKNVDLFVIGKLLGHQSPSTTTTLYAHVSTSRLHQVVDLLAD
jgi:integrase/recombinase XerD